MPLLCAVTCPRVTLVDADPRVLSARELKAARDEARRSAASRTILKGRRISFIVEHSRTRGSACSRAMRGCIWVAFTDDARGPVPRVPVSAIYLPAILLSQRQREGERAGRYRDRRDKAPPHNAATLRRPLSARGDRAGPRVKPRRGLMTPSFHSAGCWITRDKLRADEFHARAARRFAARLSPPVAIS